MNPNNGRYRFVFLGFLFPVFHYVIMLLVQITATFVKSFQIGTQMGASGTEVDVEKELTAFLTKYSDIFSLISACLTLLLVYAVYVVVVSRLKQREMPVPSVKTYFSLHKISKGLVCKLILLAFFFYHFVLGFLNLIGLLAPDLMESYRNAAESVDAGTSAF